MRGLAAAAFERARGVLERSEDMLTEGARVLLETLTLDEAALALFFEGMKR